MENKLPFGKKNYQWMIIGVLALVVGFVIMSLDTEQHGFGFLGLTLGPLFFNDTATTEIYTILHKPNE